MAKVKSGNKEEKRRRLYKLYRQRSDAFMRQFELVHEGKTYEDEAYRELSKRIEDDNNDIEKLKKELGI